VLLEAAASGLPIVAVNYGGPAEIVDEEVGHLVSADGPEELIAGLVETFRNISQNPEQWRQRGQNGRRRAEKEYGWEARMRNAVAIRFCPIPKARSSKITRRRCGILCPAT
jgi:glycosyltransferase involved in cell wall biosynthesis